METFVLRPFYHRGRECIGIFFPHTQAWYQRICKQAGAKWCQANKCWYIPLTRAGYEKLVLTLQEKVMIQKEALQLYLTKKKKMGELPPAPVPGITKTKSATSAIQNKALLPNPVPQKKKDNHFPYRQNSESEQPYYSCHAATPGFVCNCNLTSAQNQ